MERVSDQSTHERHVISHKMESLEKNSNSSLDCHQKRRCHCDKALLVILHINDSFRMSWPIRRIAQPTSDVIMVKKSLEGLRKGSNVYRLGRNRIYSNLLIRHIIICFLSASKLACDKNGVHKGNIVCLVYLFEGHRPFTY